MMTRSLACLATLAIAAYLSPARALAHSPIHGEQLRTGLAGLGLEQDSAGRLGSVADSGAPVESPNTPASLNPISLCLGSACLGSVCFGSFCAGSICFGSACTTSGCAGSGCLGSGCVGSGCVSSGCIGSVCTGSGCIGSVCVSTGCVGSACSSGSCGNGNSMRFAKHVSAASPRAGGVEVAVGQAGQYTFDYRAADGRKSTMTARLRSETLEFIRLPEGASFDGIRRS
jgi:hypothetical protein